MNYISDMTYNCEVNKVKETLEKYGIAIIPSLLNDKECKDIEHGLWTHFEEVTKEWKDPIKQDDKTSWRNIYSLFPLHGFLHQFFKIGHAQTVWNVRQNEKIVNVFSKIWSCKAEELLSSFDGVSFGMPPEITNRGYYRGNTWFHSDQSYTRNEFECVQSWVTAVDIDQDDATLVFYPNSHKYHEEFKTKFDIKDKSNWYKLNEEEESFYKEKCGNYERVHCPKGSLVLWDSRTIHCGQEPLRGRDNPKQRVVIYLCYKPRVFATESNIKKKQKAFNEQRMTTHWPCKVKLFGTKPRTYGKDIPQISPVPPPVLSELGKKLAGF